MYVSPSVFHRRRVCVGWCIIPILLCGFACPLIGQDTTPSAQDFLYKGALADGEKALTAKLKASSEDDQTRFGLGLIQFGRALENLIQDLNRHGFMTRRMFGETIFRELFSDDHPDPQVFSNQAFREMLENWVTDITKAEATLAEINDAELKFHLKPGQIQIDPAGKGKPVNAAELLSTLFAPGDRETIREFGLTLDRGDVHWLRGYLHLQAALGEFLLAHDFTPMIETGAHRVFEKVDTPHTWLLDEDRDYTIDRGFDDLILAALDGIAVASLGLDIPIEEPMRFKTVLEHLRGTIDNGEKMWQYIQAETDDENEWIPNPQQTGAIGVPVRQEMIDTWLETLAEAKRIAAGEKLVPFWRDYLTSGKPGDRGINFRKVFEHPPERLQIVLWVQGTAATPYLEKGQMTQFADEEFINRIGDVFGTNFFGFAAWFN